MVSLCRRIVAVTMYGVLFLARGTWAWEDSFNCSIFDVLCIANKVYCQISGFPVAAVFGSLEFLCKIGPSPTTDDLAQFETARETLTTTPYFTRAELDAVEMKYCKWFDSITDLTAFSTSERFIWFPTDLRSSSDLTFAIQLAHQMAHIRQYQRNFPQFRCSYLWELIRTGFSFNRDNAVEQEAFELQDKVEDCLENDYCPP